ncbi:MAG: phospholipid carrier-dependent glycosyltransferase [Candidatus Limnocylindrales bacterium]
MAGPSSREGSPRGRVSAGTSGAVTRIPAIVVLLALGLILRLIIAYVLLPGSGFPNDLGAFQAWANDIARNGPIGFYDRASFIDYPPVYLLLLGAVSLLTGGNIGEGVKLVPMFADLGLAAVVWLMALEMGVTRRRAFIAAVIVLVNPITWFNSAIWGQADAVGSIFLLLGLRELQKDRRESASALAVLAVLTKLQLGVLGFVVGFVVLRRSLAPKTGEPEPERILSSLGAGLVTAALICLPFTGLDLVGAAGRIATGPGLATIAVGLVAGVGVFSLGRRHLPVADLARRTQASALLGLGTLVVFAGMVYDSIASHLINTFGEYPYLTLNAYNPWALVAEGANAMDRSLAWIHDAPWTDAASGASGTGYLIGPFPPSVLVLALVMVVLLVVAALAGRRLSRGLEDAPDPAAVDTGADLDASRGASHRFRMEFGGLSYAFLIAAAGITAVVLIGMTGLLYAAVLGDGLLLTILIGVSIWAAWRDDAQSLLVALTVLTIAFFVVPTRAHERYLFPFFGLGAVLLVVSWRWRVAYVVLSVVNAANLLAVLVQYQGIPAADGTVAGTLNDWGNGLLSARWFDGIIWPIAVCGVTTGLAMVWALLQLRGRAVAALDREVTRAALEPEPGGWPTFGLADSYGAPIPATAPSLAAAGFASGVPATEAVPADAESSVAVQTVYTATGEPDLEGPEYAPSAPYDLNLADEDEYWAEDDSEGEDRPRYVPRLVMSLWRRLARPSSHPDRSASLDSEPRGRVDRLDLWVVVALVVVTLSLRVYRLGEPMQMYFDEVYHARSATEFLQDWRYDIPHDIYEWTHPMLAKYAIAGGITLFSDDKVTATGDINATVKATLVQPRTATSPGADPNNPNSSDPNARFGDRLFVATGSDVLVYDLQTRALVQTYSIPGAESFSTVGPTGLVYVGSSSGQIYRIDSNNLDDLQNGVTTTVKPPVELGVSAGLSITHLYSGTPPYLLAADNSGNIVSIDLNQNGGSISARGVVPGAADFADLGLGPAVLIKNASSTSLASQSSMPPTGSTTTPSSEAQALATALGLDAASVQAALDAPSTPGVPQALNLGPLSSDQVTAVQNLVAAGQLPDVQLATSDPQVIVAYQGGIGLLDVSHLILTPAIPTDSPATSIAINTNTDGSINYSQDSYVAAGNSIVLIQLDTTGNSGTVTKDGTQPLQTMPGVVTQVVFDGATRVAQALGRTPDGTGWTVYAIETNGNAVFSDAPLPFQPVAIGLDSTPQLPGTDREEVLALAPNGSIASVDVGQFAFSWRIVGVIFGVLMAACLYLLARILFRRRSIGLLVALFSVIDGMFFAQSRIAMNDTYVGGFLLLAYLIFAIIWLDVWKNRIAFWLGMPILGVLLGLGLASKWVALYAIASIGILILIRSALGRLITILGFAAATGILGSMAINEMVTQPGTGNPTAVVLLIGLALAVVVGGFVWAMSTRTTPDKVVVGVVTAVVAAGLFGATLALSPGTVENGAPNYTFFLIMLAITVIAAAVNAYHPIAWTREELRFGIGAPIVVGVLAGLVGLFIVLAPTSFTAFLRGTYPALGTGLVKLGVVGIAAGAAAAAGFWYAGRLGFGPLAAPPGPDDPSRFADPPAPAPTGWLRLGTGFGLPAAWMSACLLVLPIVVYVALYIPWSMPWQPQTEATGQLPAIACWHIDTSTGQCDNAWPAGHTGQTLWDLTIQMYNYHNDLRASHPAASPWWAWPMDLKPVWFESIGYAGDTGSMIYDGGNPALWWMAIFAMGFICWQAFKRRSLGLALIAVAFFWQWVSWSRIDRAAFQYHFYTALPFFLLGLAYFLAELWHGPSRLTWLLARFAAAAALLFSAVVWLLKYPLCGLARVSTSDYFGNTICGSGTGDVRIEARVLLIAIVLVAALAALALVLWRLERRQDAGREDRWWIAQLLVPVGIAGVLLWWLGQNGPRDLIFEAALPSDGIALVLLPVLAVFALLALRARNPRRFVLGVCVFGIAAFAVLYPNLSALPMPNSIISVYNALLPTWFYGFQFSTNLQPSTTVSPLGTWSIALAVFTILVAGAVAWAAWERRVVIGFRRWRLLSVGTEAPAATEPAGPDPAGPDATPSAGPSAPKMSRKDKPPN